MPAAMLGGKSGTATEAATLRSTRRMFAAFASC